MEEVSKGRVESKEEVKAYLQNVVYALNNGAVITFQVHRFVDEQKEERYTNQYTVNTLFPDDNPVDALRRELQALRVEEYMQTVKDIRFPERSEMREFGKVYNKQDNVYIKIRVELFGLDNRTTMFVMSFHFSEKPFTPEMFPHRKS